MVGTFTLSLNPVKKCSPSDVIPELVNSDAVRAAVKVLTWRKFQDSMGYGFNAHLQNGRCRFCCLRPHVVQARDATAAKQQEGPVEELMRICGEDLKKNPWIFDEFMQVQKRQPRYG